MKILVKMKHKIGEREMKGKNLVFEKEQYKEPRFFSFKDTFLSTKTYKVICFLCVIMMMGAIVLLIPVILGYKELFATVVGLEILAIVYSFFLILVLLGFYILLGSLLEKNIQKLNDALFKRYKMNSKGKSENG